MTTHGWKRRAVARLILVTFSSTFVACGGSPDAQTNATTTTAPPATAAPPPTTAPATAPTLPPTTFPPPPTTVPPAEPPPTLPEQAPQQLDKKALQDLVAPVALYPDVVLASLLPATTFPDQVHDAAQYVAAQPQGDVPTDRGWDGSVTGLLQFPQVLKWLDDNPGWTDEMGQAVTYQQGDVLQAIQDYRRLVSNVGNLKTNKYQHVYSEGPMIRIEPARPDVVYVPSYDPEVAVVPQPEPESQGVNPWLAFGGGAVVGALGAWALYSIFDRDHGDRITTYNNYYYGRGRRPAASEWRPRERPFRPYRGIQRPNRIQQAAVGQPYRQGRPLRAPAGGRRFGNGPGQQGLTGPAPALNPRQQRRQEAMQKRQEQQQLQQQKRQERAQQQMQQRQERQQQRQEHQQQQLQRKQEQRQERQNRVLERQQQRQENRQQKIENQQQRREQRQENRQERQQQRQEMQQQRQENRQQHQQEMQQHRQEMQQQHQEMRQERQQQRANDGGGGRGPQVERGGGGGGGGGGGHKKKHD